MKGFTIIEILAVLAILGLLAVSSVVALSALRGGSDLQAEARGFQRVLELAKSKTIASEGDTRYGVYATSTSPHRYILFQGNDYASRVVAEDEVYKLRDAVEFASMSFSGLSGQEVVFDRIQGTTSNVGNAVLREKANPSNATTVYVESSGTVEIGTSNPPTGGACVPGGNRICDSRHVHIDYTGRTINTATETIVLNFDSGAKIETIPMASYVSGGQIVWEGTINVAGQDQTLKIHTHKLNNGFDSQFSVHRDKRFNTKALTIEINGSPDPDSGTLLIYDAAGVTTQGTSAYASAPIAQ